MHRRQPAQFAEQPPNPGTCRQPVRTDRSHHHQALRGHPAEQEPEEVRRGRVHPLQVLDRDDDRATGASNTREQGGHGVEELEPSRLIDRRFAGRIRVGQRAHQRKLVEDSGDLRVSSCHRLNAPDQVDHGQVRQAGIAQIDALRPHDQCLRNRQSLQHRADQPGLPYARLAFDQDSTGLAVGGIARGGSQNRQLMFATDERHVALGSHHGGIIAPTTASSKPKPGCLDALASPTPSRSVEENGCPTCWVRRRRAW